MKNYYNMSNPISIKTLCFTVLTIMAFLLMSVPAEAKIVERVSGGGKNFHEGFDAVFSLGFQAKKDDQGNVSGQLEFHDPNRLYHVAIDCLEVDGNQAWISGEILKDVNNTGESTVLFQIEDGGPMDRIGPPDFDEFIDCTDKPEFALSPWENGNLTIHKMQP